MFSHHNHSLHSLRLGLVLIFTLLMAATSWADEFKQKKFEGVEIDEIPDQTYTADSICPTPDIDVPDSLKPFVKDTDYKVYCYDNVNAGEATLVIEGIGKYAGTIETIFIINKAPLTVTAKNDTITYGDEPSNAGVEYSGFVGDDNENDLNDSIAFNYDYVQFDKVGKYVIIPSGLSSDNYDITFVEGELTVEPKKLTVTAKNDTITYGDEPSNAGVEYSGFVGDDNESSLDDSLIFSYEYGQYGKPGDYAIIPSGPRSDKYEIEFVEGKLTVLPKKLTVTALNDTIVYGDEPSNVGVEFSGFIDGENEKSLNGTLVYSNEYKQYGNVGEYAITPSGLTADNYEIEFVAGKLMVEPKVVFIAWDDETSFTYDGKAHAPNAAAEGLVNNDECNLVIDSATNAGKYTAKVTDLSNKNYKLPATGLEQSFEIAKIPLTVTAKNATIVYGDEPSNAGVEYSGFVVTDNEKSLNGSLVYSYDYKQYGNVGEYSVTPSGLTADNYEIEFVAGKLTVEPKAVSIAWGKSSFAYNGAAQVPAATAEGLVNSDKCGLTVAGAATNAGKYTATVTGLNNKNYKLPAIGLEQAFEITKANPTIVKSPVAVENLVYNGKAQTLVTAGEAKNGTLVYKLASEEKYSEALPTATNGGDYTVYFMVLGDENYNDLKAETLTASIKVPASSSSVIASSSSSAPASSSSTVEPGSSSSDSTTPVATTTLAGTFRVAYARNELVVTNSVASELKVAVFDVQGSLKMHYRGSAAGNHFVSLKKFVPGIYLVRVESSGKMQMLQVHVK